MIGSETLGQVLALAGVGVTAIATVTASVFANRVRKDIRTGNGHSVGHGVARTEDRLVDVANAIDAIDVQLRELRFFIQRHEAQYHHVYRHDWDAGDEG